MKQRKFRAKVAPIATVAGDDDDDDDGPGIVLGAAVAKKTERAKKDRTTAKIATVAVAGVAAPDKPSRTGLLSFGDDDGGPAVVLRTEPKKPLRSAAATAQQRQADASAGPSSTQRSAPGEYSAERLQALQQSTPVLVSKPRQEKEPAFKLSGSFKRATAAVDDRFTTNGVKSATVLATSPSPGALLPPPPRPAAQSAPSRTGGAAALAAPGVAAAGSVPAVQPATGSTAAGSKAEADDDDDYFPVPDAEAIRRAKQKRERLRSAHLAPDYIPLGGAAGLTASSNAEAAARLRGDGGGGGDAAGADGDAHSDDEDPEAEDALRMQFMGADRPDKARARARAGMQERGHDGEEDDDAWVRQQIRAGAGRGLSAAQQPVAAAAMPAGSRSAADVFTAAPPQRSAGAVSAATPEHVAAAAAAVMSSLQTSMRQLQASHQHVRKELGRTSQQLTDSIASVGGLDEDLAAAKAKYTYMQEVRGYIADLCDMLQERSPIIEVLEERLLKAAEERCAAAIGAAAADDAEELRAPEAAVAAAVGVLSRGGAVPAAQAAAEAAAAAAEASEASSLPEDLDEYGRDRNMEKRRESSTRKAALQARLAREGARIAAAAGRQGERQEAAWGDATSDEDEAEMARYSRERGQILEGAATVFADADESFATVGALKGRLEGWRGRYPAAFRDAYMTVSSPAVFSPFVRLELLAWDPVYGASGAGFDSQRWYEQLFDYGLPPQANGNGAAPPAPQAADEELIPALVQNLVAPRLLHAVKHAWNPLNRRQSAAVASVHRDLLVYLQPTDPLLQELAAAVTAKLRDTVDRLRVPPWPSTAVAVSSAATIVRARRFGRAVRLLANVAAFDGLLPADTLAELALRDVVRRQVLQFIRSTPTNVGLTLERTARVVHALPPRWFTGPQRQLAEPLVEHVRATARSLEKQQQRGEGTLHMATNLAQLKELRTRVGLG